MGDELSETVIHDLRDKVVAARAGDLSVYGLLSLIDSLGPFTSELERAKRKSEEGSGQVGSSHRRALDAEQDLGKAPGDVKKILAEELNRALRPGGSGFTARERTRALAFVEGQLRAAAKDPGNPGNEVRCKMLREKRSELETCDAAIESQGVRKIETQLGKARVEFNSSKAIYDSWQAGKTKFKSNDELQQTKRRFETARKLVSGLEAEIDAELCKRRVPTPAATSSTSWASEPKPSNMAPASCSGTGPQQDGTGPGNATPDHRKKGARGGASTPGDAPKTHRSDAKGDSLRACMEADEAEAAERARRPAQMAKRAKDPAQKQAMKDAKLRGQELLMDLRADLGPSQSAPVRSTVPAARAKTSPAAWGGAVNPAVGPTTRLAWTSAQASQFENSADSPVQSVAVASAADASVPNYCTKQEEPPGLPDKWEAIWSEEHERHYYWNVDSGAVQWEEPEHAVPVAHLPQVSQQDPEIDKVQEAIVAKLGQRQQKGTYWSEDPDVQKLSFECACRAIAEVLGITFKEVQELEVPSVEDWRVNFTRAEWDRVRSRALALEAAKRTEAQKFERERAQRKLEKKTSKTSDGLAKGAMTGGKQQPGGTAVAAALQSIPGGVPKAKPAAAPNGAPPAAAAGKAAGKKKAKGSAGANTANTVKDLTGLAHKNKFAGFCSSDSDD